MNKPQLGFGLMRLPESNNRIDIDQVSSMVDKFLESGFTYFDTAWGYHNGMSEDTLRQTVVERHPRENFTVATKFPIWAATEQADVQKIFDTQLKRTGAGYFDYYLIHSINSGNIDKINNFGVWDFIMAQKASGLCKSIGFSFHDKADMLDQLLTAHPEVDFVQLQINYADWDSKKVQSRLCYEVCVKHKKPVIVMEPVKGGSLSAMPDNARLQFLSAKPDDSLASWAMRFCGSLSNVSVILSGMSNLSQMNDNIKTLKHFAPMTQADYSVIEQVMAILNTMPSIPCTACNYCTEQCPQKINIPGIFGNYNEAIVFMNISGMRRSYNLFNAAKIKASDCLECGLCESRCPQNIHIIEELKKCAKLFEE